MERHLYQRSNDPQNVTCKVCGEISLHTNHVQEEKLTFSSGTTSTKQTRLSLIPHFGLVNAAARFELGLSKHGKEAYNALSPNQAPLKDEEWLIERCSHAIEHAYSLIDFLTHKSSDVEKAKGDAGAVAWCGLTLGEALCRKDSK